MRQRTLGQQNAPASATSPEDLEYLTDCHDVLKALKGDIVAMAKIADKLGNNDIHLRSFICSMI